MATRVCTAEGCSVRYEGHRNRIYCSKTCREREAKRRWRQKSAIDVIDPKRVRKGDPYATLDASPELVAALKDKTIAQRTAAAAIGVAESMFSEAYATFLFDRANIAKAADWTRAESVDRELAAGGFDWDGDLTTLEAWLDQAIDGFVSWRSRHFRTPRGPYLTREFHRVWIKGVLKTIVTGSRYLILSPPRHGKSELLVHFVVWLICRNPDIRILWIGGNSDIASDMVGAVKQNLEDNEALRAETLGPGRSWPPAGRRQVAWGNTKLTVSGRTVISKAPTLRSVGRGGKILSMDVDLIICDDIEDFDSTLNDTSRTQTRSWWFNNVESRKEEHTAWVTIGSRQHPDDLYDYLLSDDEWEVTVDTAHDATCGKDPDVAALHVDCMLFGELRSYRWLASKRRSAESQGLLANFEMVYLNDPRPPGLLVYRQESIDQAKNWGRGIGLEGLPTNPDTGQRLGFHLIGGIDPSATGFQAAFLWAWVKEQNRMYAIDLNNRKGGGVYQALELMVEWFDAYGCQHFVIEDNNFQRAIGENRDVRDWATASGVYLEGHQTYGNKNDPAFGVGAMAHMYEEHMIDLPWGTVEAREKMGIYQHQMIRFVDAAGAMRRTARKSDVLMASWFPMKVIRRLQKERQAQISSNYDPSFADYDVSDLDSAPW